MKGKPLKKKLTKRPDHKLLAAYARVVNALVALDEDQRWRVIRAALALFERGHP